MLDDLSFTRYVKAYSFIISFHFLIFFTVVCYLSGCFSLLPFLWEWTVNDSCLQVSSYLIISLKHVLVYRLHISSTCNVVCSLPKCFVCSAVLPGHVRSRCSTDSGTGFSRKLNGEERRPTSGALISMTKNETAGPASNDVSRQCEFSQRNGQPTIGSSPREVVQDIG